MPYITAAVIAGTAIYGAIDASSRRKKAAKALEKLKKVNPKFRDAASIQREADSLIKQGYSPEEAANFQQRLTRGQNQAYRLSTDRNPNLAPAIQAGINYSNVQAQNEFAASDAALRRQKVNDYIGLTTGQSNAQTQAEINNKRDQEIAYGNAKSQANADIYNSLSQLGYAGASAGSTYSANRVTSTPKATGSASMGSDIGKTAGVGMAAPTYQPPSVYTTPTTPTNQQVVYPTVSPYGNQAYSPYGAPIFNNKTTVPFYQQSY